jgi:hypothetical protein
VHRLMNVLRAATRQHTDREFHPNGLIPSLPVLLPALNEAVPETMSTQRPVSQDPSVGNDAI